MEDMWEENKGCFITLFIVIGIACFFVFRPYQLDALFAFFTPGSKNRVAVHADEVIRMHITTKPTEWLKRYGELIVQRTGVTAAEATDIATDPVTNTQGGMVFGTVVASELPSIPAGQEYILFSPVPIPKEVTLICNYEPDVTGYIFFTSTGFGAAPKPVYVTMGDPGIPDYFKKATRKIIVANAELRGAGMGDHLFLRQAKKPAPAATPP